MHITTSATFRPWSAWPPRRQQGFLLAVALVGVGVLVALGYLQSKGLALAQRDLGQLQAQIRQAEEQQVQARSQDRGPAQGSVAEEAKLDPVTWPPQNEGIDAWVRSAAQAAAGAAGIQLVQLSITYPQDSPTQTPTSADMATMAKPSTAPYAVLQVSARGAYPALKAWQADMQSLMPSLGVEHLRWLGAANDGTGLLSAEWTWRLWLRPAGSAPSTSAVAELVPLRPVLASAQKDPFRGFVPPPPPPPVYVAPPEQAVQVPPPPPPLRWETLGYMQGLDGQHRVTGFWEDGGDPASIVTLVVGDAGPRGHRVTRITPRLIELVHPQTQEHLQFSLPQAPRFERR